MIHPEHVVSLIAYYSNRSKSILIQFIHHELVITARVNDKLYFLFLLIYSYHPLDDDGVNSLVKDNFILTLFLIKSFLILLITHFKFKVTP